MANNIYHDPNYNFPQPRQPGGMAAYLLGMGPMPPPHPQDVAVAMFNRAMDNPGRHPAAGVDDDNEDDEDENIDPQLRGQLQTQATAGGRVTVRLLVNSNNGKVTRDIEFPSDIPRRDFCDRVMAAMGLDANTAELGWKTSDEAKRAPAHQLADDSDIDNAFKTILNIQNNVRRKKEILLEIVHLNPAPVQAPKKKNDGNRVTDFAYSAELRLVQEKLRCAQHSGPNRWCYVSPEHPNEHVALGYEEISLWARKIHDNDADPNCVVPPNCLALDNLRQRASCVRRGASKQDVPPIHVHINNTPLGDTSRHNISSGSAPQSVKRHHSLTSEGSSDSEEESLSVSDALQIVHARFPQLDLPQYMSLLKEQKILYAETMLEFDLDFFVGLGIPEGAVRPMLGGVRKVLVRDKKQRKRARIFQREPSVEI